MGVYAVPVTKGKGSIEVDTEKLPETVYREALVQGLKVLLNRGMTKITKETYPVAAELAAAAMEKAQATFTDMMAGKIRIMGAKADKVSGAVMTEARRIARALVKEAMKERKIKISYVEASEITKAANALIAANPEIVKQAETNIEARAVEQDKLKAGLDQIVTPSMVNEQKKAKAEAAKAQAKAEAGDVLSAAKAGQIKATPKKGQGKPAPQATA